MNGKYQALFAMFQFASTKLKYPKIRFIASTEHQESVVLYLATRGYIAVKVDGVYVGKLADANSFRMYSGTTELQCSIESFCSNPLESAIVKGQQYGNCCFCGIELTNRASLQMGYGPICADKYGLPWHFTEPALADLGDFNGKTAPFHKNDQY